MYREQPVLRFSFVMVLQEEMAGSGGMAGHGLVKFSREKKKCFAS